MTLKLNTAGLRLKPPPVNRSSVFNVYGDEHGQFAGIAVAKDDTLKDLKSSKPCLYRVRVLPHAAYPNIARERPYYGDSAERRAYDRGYRHGYDKRDGLSGVDLPNAYWKGYWTGSYDKDNYKCR